jgi:long-subunit acyl-CoA synthetase (AMP-forming)
MEKVWVAILMVSGSAALQPRLARIFAAAEIPVMEGYGFNRDFSCIR